MDEVLDLLIEDGDLVFGSDGEPLTISNQAAIAQDLKHRIKESGLVPKLVAARGQENQTTLQQIKIVAKHEERIRPDSVNILDLGEGNSQITAITNDDEFIAVNM